MGVNGILTTARRQISRRVSALVLTRRGDESTSGSIDEDEDSSPEFQVATARRERERGQFNDDGAYFEFLIERALDQGASDANEPA